MFDVENVLNIVKLFSLLLLLLLLFVLHDGDDCVSKYHLDSLCRLPDFPCFCLVLDDKDNFDFRLDDFV